MESSTVTVASALAEFPTSSVTVRLTVLSPKSAHVNVVTSKLKFAIEQLSVEPLSISPVVMEAFPDPSN